MNMGTGIDFESHKHQLVDVKIGDFGLFSWFVDSDTNTSINFLQLLFVAVFLHNHSLNSYHTRTVPWFSSRWSPPENLHTQLHAA